MCLPKTVYFPPGLKLLFLFALSASVTAFDYCTICDPKGDHTMCKYPDVSHKYHAINLTNIRSFAIGRKSIENQK